MAKNEKSIFQGLGRREKVIWRALVFQLFQFQLGFRGSVLLQTSLIILYNYLIINNIYNKRHELIPLEN